MGVVTITHHMAFDKQHIPHSEQCLLISCLHHNAGHPASFFFPYVFSSAQFCFSTFTAPNYSNVGTAKPTSTGKQSVNKLRNHPNVTPANSTPTASSLFANFGMSCAIRSASTSWSAREDRRFGV